MESRCILRGSLREFFIIHGPACRQVTWIARIGSLTLTGIHRRGAQSRTELFAGAHCMSRKNAKTPRVRLRSPGFTAEERRVARSSSLARKFFGPRMTRITRIGSLALTGIHRSGAQSRAEYFAGAKVFWSTDDSDGEDWFAGAHCPYLNLINHGSDSCVHSHVPCNLREQHRKYS